MTATLEQVINSLRDELQQYGEMLALLELQHESVLRQGPESVLTSISAVEAQASTIGTARRTREAAQRQLAWALGQPNEETLRALLPLLPEPYRPLVGALMDEINELLQQVQVRARSNHGQLERSLALMERFLASISAQAHPVQTPQDEGPTNSPLNAAVM